MKISIIIPAHNEQNRIEKTVRSYHAFFAHKKKESNLDFELIIVLNGCTDNTLAVTTAIQKDLGSTIIIINSAEGGKGLAITLGFDKALHNTDNDLIGFVDADMATAPEAFFDLIVKIESVDGAIASRYMPGALISPARPLYKRWGSRIIYEPIVRYLFGLTYYDLQCGAKLFKRSVIQKILPLLTEKQWSFDVELLYLCKKYGFTVREVPTIWHDQAESKLTLKSGIRMLSALVRVYKKHQQE